VDLSTLQLSDALTAAGAVGVAALIAGVIALAKNLRGIGPWLDAGNEPAVVFVLAALIVAAAVASAGVAVTLPTIFAAFVAWYGIAEVAMAVHDRSGSITPLVLTQPPPAS
jgi:hypothetical protein